MSAVGASADIGRPWKLDGFDAHDPNVWSGRALQEDIVDLADAVTRVRMRREDRSSISSHLLADLGGLLRHRSLFIDAVPLFVPCDRSFVPTCAPRRAARRGRQGWPSRRPCVLLLRCQATP